MPPNPDQPEAWTGDRGVADVVRELGRHPVRLLLRQWNWKTAVMTAALRGVIFFVTHLSTGLGSAAEVLARDLLFRIPLGGFYGAVSQAFSRAGPPWAVYMVVIVALPALVHVAEFLVHWTGGAPRLGTAMAVSIVVSVVSALFNLFLMRRGALLVGNTAPSLGTDLRRLPALFLEFVIRVPVAVHGAWRRRTRADN